MKSYFIFCRQIFTLFSADKYFFLSLMVTFICCTHRSYLNSKNSKWNWGPQICLHIQTPSNLKKLIPQLPHYTLHFYTLFLKYNLNFACQITHCYGSCTALLLSSVMLASLYVYTKLGCSLCKYKNMAHCTSKKHSLKDIYPTQMKCHANQYYATVLNDQTTLSIPNTAFNVQRHITDIHITIKDTLLY